MKYGTRAPGRLVFFGKTPRTQYSWRMSRLRERASRSPGGRAETSLARKSRSTVAKRARIRARLAAVERDLRAKDVSARPPGERLARSRNLDILHEYWVRGVFPKNTSLPGARVPYFIDRYGTRCATAS